MPLASRPHPSAVFHFFTPYWSEVEGDYVYSHAAIARHYMSRMFLVDVVTTLPWDLMIDTSDYELIRLIRLGRLIKCGKVLKALRSNKLVDRLKVRYGVSSTLLSLVTFVFLLVLEAHWMACLWHLVAILQRKGSLSWVRTAELTMPYFSSAFEHYSVALQWAVGVITIVGSSEVRATNPTERAVEVVCEIVAACIYAVLIGYTAGVLTRLDVAQQEVGAQRDDLNRYMVRPEGPPRATAAT